MTPCAAHRRRLPSGATTRKIGNGFKDAHCLPQLRYELRRSRSGAAPRALLALRPLPPGMGAFARVHAGTSVGRPGARRGRCRFGDGRHGKCACGRRDCADWGRTRGSPPSPCRWPAALSRRAVRSAHRGRSFLDRKLCAALHDWLVGHRVAAIDHACVAAICAHLCGAGVSLIVGGTFRLSSKQGVLF